MDGLRMTEASPSANAEGLASVLREIRQSLLEKSARALAFRSQFGKERCSLIGVPAVSRDLSNRRLHLFDRTVVDRCARLF